MFLLPHDRKGGIAPKPLAWEDWRKLVFDPTPGKMLSGPGACSFSLGGPVKQGINLFALYQVGSALPNMTTRTYFTGPPEDWWEPEYLDSRPSPTMQGDPAAVSWGYVRIDVFCCLRQIRTVAFGDCRGGFPGLGEGMGKPWWSVDVEPWACSWGPNHLDVFAVGTDNALWHNWYEGQWGGWQSLGTGPDGFNGPCAAVSRNVNNIDLFAVGTDLVMYHKWWDGQWSDWVSLGGQFAPATGPGVCSWRPNRLDPFGVGSDNALWHKAWDGQWGDWETLGGQCSSDPAAVATGAEVVHVYVRGTDTQMWKRSSVFR